MHIQVLAQRAILGIGNSSILEFSNSTLRRNLDDRLCIVKGQAPVPHLQFSDIMDASKPDINFPWYVDSFVYM